MTIWSRNSVLVYPVHWFHSVNFQQCCSLLFERCCRMAVGSLHIMSCTSRCTDTRGRKRWWTPKLSGYWWMCKYAVWNWISHKGNNLPCDLHNENVNRLFKEVICNMGANFTEISSTRAARSVSSLEKMAKIFDNQTTIHPEATAHSRKSDHNDVIIVVDIIMKSQLLECTDRKRSHSSFSKFSADPLHKLNREAMKKWITKKAKDHLKFIISDDSDSDSEEDS